MLAVAGSASRRAQALQSRYPLSAFVRFVADLAADTDRSIVAAATPGLREALGSITARGNALDTAIAGFLRKSDSQADTRLIHDRAIAAGCDRATFVGNVLVQSYGRCGDIPSAMAVFEAIQERNVYSWNNAITAFAANGHFDEAVGLFHEMERSCSTPPNRVTFLAVLGACADLRDLDETRSIHARIKHQIEDDVILANAIIHTYRKCGSVEDGKAVFDAMRRRDVVSWTSMMACFVQDGHLGSRQALELFRNMDAKPTEVTFVTVLEACSSIGDLDQGRKIHAEIVNSGFEPEVLAGKRLANSLINMYSKCGSLEDAKEVFDRMKNRDLSGWNAMIGAFAQRGRAAGAVSTFSLMELDGTKPSTITLTSLLTALSGTEMLRLGTEIEERVRAGGVEADIILVNTFITSYSKCGSLEESIRVFETMTRRNTQSWNAIIGACVQHGRIDDAIGYFYQMDAKRDEVTFISVLGACSEPRLLEDGAAIHGMVLSSGLEQDPVLGSALVNMYSKCRDLANARSVFDRLVWKTVVSWTAMIEAYVQSGCGREALKIFRMMELEGCNPNEVTFASVLGACTAAEDFALGRSIQLRIQSKSDNVLVALVTLYSKCGKIETARELFDGIKTKTTLAWNSMLSASSQQGQGLETISLFETMIQAGSRPNSVTFMSVLPGCSHNGLINRSRDCFRSMIADHAVTATVDLYGTMVDLLSRQGHLDESEDLIESMPYHPDVVVWTSLLGSCKTYADAERGYRIAGNVMELDQVVSAPYSLLTSVIADVDE